MKTAQSSHVPAEGQRPSLSDLPWLTIYAARGLFELVRARIIFNRMEARDIPERNKISRSKTNNSLPITQRDLLRIAYVLPRLSDRLPWRSDCLIQALAGQNWLLSKGAGSEIRIGVEKPKDGEFGAHAWLVHKEQVVTGGDIDRYQLLLSDSGADSTR